MKRTRVVVLAAVIAVVIAVALMVVMLGKSRHHPQPVDEAATAIVFVHGYTITSGCPGINVAAYWRGVTASITAAGWKNPLVLASYYECDSNGTNIDSVRSAHDYFPSGERGLSGAVTYSQKTDIRHLAYVLAWYIYDSYSKHDRLVDLVGHSMGGLVIRWALEQVAAHDASFPPTLLVQNAITISTPYLGAAPPRHQGQWMHRRIGV
jgi:triacylglycerol esterase/lipase EstA (alpha/beta hydrolase family)